MSRDIDILKQQMMCAYLGIPESCNPWVNLFQRDDYQQRFEELKKAGISPTHKELSYRASDSDLNAWDAFFAKNITPKKSKLVFFNSLIKAKYYPSAVECDKNNVWCWLASNASEEENTGYKIFRQLLDWAIFPSNTALNLSDAGANTWFWLASSNDGHSIFTRLLDSNIIPSDTALNTSLASGLHVGANAWFWLAEKDESPVIIFRLLDLGVKPSSTALNTPIMSGSAVGLTAWYYLAAKNRAVTMNKLLDLNIIPSAASLNAQCSTGESAGKNGWWWLAYHASKATRGPSTIQRLFEEGVINSDSVAAFRACPTSGSYVGKTVWSLIEQHAFYMYLCKLITKATNPAIDDTTRLLINSAYEEIYVPALYCIGFLYAAQTLLLPFDVCLLMTEFLLSKQHLQRMNALCFTSNDDGCVIFDSKFLLSVWRFCFLSRLQEYNKQDAHSLSRKVIFQLESDDVSPAEIFKMLWLQLHQQTNKKDTFSKILASGIRLFPRHDTLGAFKKDELPRLMRD